MKKLIVFALLFLAATARGAVTDGACDLSTQPAATLLLPYFQVSLDEPPGEARTTIFTLVNTKAEPQIARITLWTNAGVPLITFPVFLTGYDVQPFDLHDLLVRGVIAPPNGTTNEVSPGPLSSPDNPHFLPTAAGNCRSPRLERHIPALLLPQLHAALRLPSGYAGGYATIDAVTDCDYSMPSDPRFFELLSDDNALTGDYQFIHPPSRSAHGSPLVHLRAVPDLPKTFYGRGDRRQPLPSSFAVRSFQFSDTMVWQEGEVVGAGELEAVQFDERENPLVVADVAMPGVDGWTYLNNGSRQSWVTMTTVFTETYATPLGNGCAPRAPAGGVIRPRELTTDSCDIAVAPAATLLLPLFEVDVTGRTRSTSFSVTNVSPQPQIAHVTLWTDHGYPVLGFNLFLTGYDVQAIDLREVLVNGLIAPEEQGTSNAATPGARSLANNPKFLGNAPATCSRPGQDRGIIPAQVQQSVILALTGGTLPLSCGSTPVGGEHRLATGYVTIDVVATCTSNLPTDRAYFERDLLYDNVLTGDYSLDDDDSNPLVHIRAVETPHASTFYENYSRNRGDRRQPLPRTFAVRAVEGALTTDLTIWRQPSTGAGATCAGYANARLPFDTPFRFDERENPALPRCYGPPPCSPHPEAAPAFRMATDDERLPVNTTGHPGGWMVLSLDRQSWVTTRIGLPGTSITALFDATALGNGCSAPAAVPAVPIGRLP
ncbi:MAG TPA: hypothetical protein VF618_09295 [Thermoanaerobaculia bacterium]